MPEVTLPERNTFGRQYKPEAIRQMEAGDKKTADLARELGVPRNKLYKWRIDDGDRAPLAQAGAGSRHRSGHPVRDLPTFEQHPDLESNPNQNKEIGHEEALYRRADHRLPARGRRRHADQDLCRKHGFSEVSYYLWRGKFGGLDVSDAKRLKALEAENAKLKELLAEAML